MGYDSEDSYSSDSSSSSSTSKSRDWKGGLRGAGASLSQTGRDMTDSARASTAAGIHAVQYHRGGKVRKTGLARLEAGERVIAKGKRKRVDRLMKRDGMKMRAKRRR